MRCGNLRIPNTFRIEILIKKIDDRKPETEKKLTSALPICD